MNDNPLDFAIFYNSTISIPSHRKIQLTLKRPVKIIIEVEDVFFHTNSSVFIPNQVEERIKKSKYPRNGINVLNSILFFLFFSPSKYMLVAGHTDTTGDDCYNRNLAQLRSQAILFLVENDKAAWIEQFSSQKKDEVQIYVNEDIQQILQWTAIQQQWECAPGSIDGIIGDKTRAAIKSFQESYNVNYRAVIPVDGFFGPLTWGAYFDIVQDEMRKQINKALKPFNATIDAIRKRILWYDPSNDPRKSITACGETFPIDNAQKGNYRSEKNRRVEICFFDRNERVELPCIRGKCVKKKCLIYGKNKNGDTYYIPKYITDDYSFYRFSQ
jgi:outer membrane protein OmpA-like peptidoglycan-associated protein